MGTPIRRDEKKSVREQAWDAYVSKLEADGSEDFEDFNAGWRAACNAAMSLVAVCRSPQSDAVAGAVLAEQNIKLKIALLREGWIDDDD